MTGRQIVRQIDRETPTDRGRQETDKRQTDMYRKTTETDRQTETDGQTDDRQNMDLLQLSWGQSPPETALSSPKVAVGQLFPLWIARLSTGQKRRQRCPYFRLCSNSGGTAGKKINAGVYAAGRLDSRKEQEILSYSR